MKLRLKTVEQEMEELEYNQVNLSHKLQYSQGENNFDVESLIKENNFLRNENLSLVKNKLIF